MEALKLKPQPSLTLLKGGRKKGTSKRYITATWQIAYAALWPGKVFTDEQKEDFISLIKGYYLDEKKIAACAMQIIQRILLAKRYVDRSSKRYIPKPADWLNINFTYGISGTKAWYDRIAEERKNVPHYNEGIELFAEGILKFLCTSTSKNYSALHETLIKHEQYDLIPVLHTIIAIRKFGK